MSGLADLAAEAMNSIQEGIDDLDAQIEQALSCPCIGTSQLLCLGCSRSWRQHRCGEEWYPNTSDGRAIDCAGDLKDGPCGQTFVGAFTCYIKSTHEEKGMDCLDQFKLFQECLKQHPDHVEKIMQEATSEEVVDEEGKNNGGTLKSESPTN